MQKERQFLIICANLNSITYHETKHTILIYFRLFIFMHLGLIGSRACTRNTFGNGYG